MVSPKKGFRLRPLDIGLLIAGVLVVGFIVFSAFQAPPEAVSAGSGVPESAQPVPVGQAAPDFTVRDIEGKSYTLSAQKGKVVVLEFMATWCPHCQNDAPMFNQLNSTYSGRGVEVWAVNATPRGRDGESTATMDDLKWFRSTYQLNHPILFDKTLASAISYGVRSYPSVYIVGKDGVVGFQPPTDALPTYDQLAAKVEELLAKQ